MGVNAQHHTLTPEYFSHAELKFRRCFHTKYAEAHYQSASADFHIYLAP